MLVFVVFAPGLIVQVDATHVWVVNFVLDLIDVALRMTAPLVLGFDVIFRQQRG